MNKQQIEYLLDVLGVQKDNVADGITHEPGMTTTEELELIDSITDELKGQL